MKLLILVEDSSVWKVFLKLNMLFYYIRPDKETISDLISINVVESLDNDIGVQFGTRATRPGATARLNIESSANQILCISVRDRAYEILEEKHDYRNKLFSEIEDFTTEKNRDWWGFDPKSFWSVQTRDSAYAFQSAGLIYLTGGVQKDKTLKILVIPRKNPKNIEIIEKCVIFPSFH